MTATADSLQAVATLFAEAPLTEGGWPIALDALARCTGGWSGEMMWYAGANLIVNVGGGISTEVLEEFEDRGGGDPRINPRIAAAFRAPAMSPVTEPDFISIGARERHPLYQEFFAHCDADFASFARLDTGPEIQAFITVLRSKTQSRSDLAETEAFRSLLPVIARAAQTQLAISRQGLRSVLSAFASLNMAVVFCDRHGKVLDASPAAEGLLSSEDTLSARSGRLTAIDAKGNARLQDAFRKACVWPPTLEPTSTAVPLRSAAGEVFLVEVTPLPRSREQPTAGAELLVLINPRPAKPLAVVLIQLGLTEAEAHLTLALTGGLTLLEAADARGVSRNTAHAQLNSIYAKLGINRQAELAALVSRLR
jgi:DNA-binding CsgD family transcriptional regulator